MATAVEAIWAIDLGNSSLKALHLVGVGEVVQVIGFDQVQHGKILNSTSVKPAEREELIALSVRQFVQRNDIGYDSIAIAVPSQNSFSRFVTLPPVEEKRIPEIVRFEAAQQIPFDINEVVWDWQLMTAPGATEKKVGLFAIKNEVVNAAIEYFDREDLQVSFVQMTPMALYNFLLYERPDLFGSETKAVALLNVGAECTDLVVCTASTVWQRCIVMGGNSFTNAISETFKLSFEKAEKLKRTAAVSKYARQIFQAMRPVFTDFGAEVQRSLSFFGSAHANIKPVRMVAMGGGTRLRGLCKYLQQTLQIPVERPDAFKRLALSEGLSAAKFHESVSDFGVVYGLGLQGLGLGRIESNLLPGSVVRSMAWASKLKYFIGAACLLLVVSLLCLARIGLDTVTYGKNEAIRRQVNRAVQPAREMVEEKQGSEARLAEFQGQIKKHFDLFQYRQIVPELTDLILSLMPNAKNNPAQADLYKAFANRDVESIMKVQRPDRKQLFVTTMSIYYSDDLAAAQFGATAQMRKTDLLRAEELATVEGGPERSLYEEDPYRDMGYGPGLGYGGAQQQEKDLGFVVTVIGYSPYKDVRELLEPANVDKDPKRWGFVTRLLHLDALADGNSPFALYKKTDKTADPNHYKLQYGPVDTESYLPAGVGVWDAVAAEGTGLAPAAGGATSTVDVLRDPLTWEIISTMPVVDSLNKAKIDPRSGKPMLKTHDQWFEVRFKLKWKDAPKTVTAPAPGAAPDGAVGQPVPPAPEPAPAPATDRPSRRAPRGVDDM